MIASSRAAVALAAVLSLVGPPCLVPARAAAQELLTSRDLGDLPSPPPDRRIAYGDGPLQYGNLRLPPGEGPFPVVLFVHGGCWLSAFDIAHVASLEEALRGAGYAVWSLEYRRVGDEGGGWPGTFLDVARGADHLREVAREVPLDLDRVVAAGHSAGGYFALWLSVRDRLPAGSGLRGDDPLPVAGVFALAPAPDLEELHAQQVCGGVVDGLMGGSPAAVPERYDQASMMRLPPPAVPTTVLVGAHDRGFGPSGRRWLEHARAEGDTLVRQVELPESGHFEMIVPTTSTWPRVLAELAALEERIGRRRPGG